MSEQKNIMPQSDEQDALQKTVTEHANIKPVQIILPVLVLVLIMTTICVYSLIQRINVARNAEAVTGQMAEYIAENIANEIDYGESSIRLAAVSIVQTMSSATLEDPSGVIIPMIDNTPFGGIEYIRTDGMNVVNIGEPFDASDRVYYIEGMKGNTGIWNNYHPKTSKETLMNFYTPLIYDGEVAGVITGYIEATTQLSPLFETKLYGQPIHGLLIDENNRVICSTIASEYEPDLTLEKFLSRFVTDTQKEQRLCERISQNDGSVITYQEADGEGRISVVQIPDTGWKVAIIVPAASFYEIIGENTRTSVITIVIISAVLLLYATYILLRNVRRRKEIAILNAELAEKNKLAFSEITEIRDIIASANMGTWRILQVEGKASQMYVDDTMRKLLGIVGSELTPEQIYDEWFYHIKPEAIPSVFNSVERMKQGLFDENTYLWIHPQKGVRYVRCGGTAQKVLGGYVLRGYHYDVDDVVREDQAKVAMLRAALDEKNEYYATLGALGDIFYSIHMIDLQDDSVIAFSAKDIVREIVNHKDGAHLMMEQVIAATTRDEYREEALAFTDLSTIADRMQNKQIISKQFIGKNTGWFLASFIVREVDEDGKPTKIIFTTRVIDDEKKQEEWLIQKSQTDELTGVLNRRAYEENIYEHNDTPDTEEFTYISLDVNGLKVVNDTKGHSAGDELIVGASWCMKKTLGLYGKLYRIGGDEFVAILFCNAQKVLEILNDFDATIANWSGKLIDQLSISYGWISKEEKPGLSVRQLGAIAEQRMYDAKDAHYRKQGVDRRGQHDAHKALCNLYTKILKINLTDDSFHIINMDTEEQTQEKGFSNMISEWLASFGTSGQVHPDDLEEYLRTTDLQFMREYFMNNKTSLHVFYRRKLNTIYKQVMMEIIPANDYSDSHQSLFLYVKDIDK